MALIDDFKTRFPGFDTGVVDTYFPLIEPTYCCYYDGDLEDPCDKEIILNLLAHLLVLETQPADSSIQNQTSVKVGDVSTTFQNKTINNDDDAFFGSTKYGQKYLQLTSKKKVGVFFV